jgi:cellulose biosynthesis protein BcsQ
LKILACYNLKGGVGKTAAAVNLSYLAAQAGWRTLVWDLDPQGAASYYFRVKPKVKKGGKGLFKGKRTLEDAVKGTDYDNIDLVPADFSYRNMDVLLHRTRKPDKQIRKLLKPLAPDYDVVFLDCPPSISLVSEAMFFAADALLIPTIPTFLSLRSLAQIQKFLLSEGLDQLQLMPFFSMVDLRKRVHREIVGQRPALLKQFTSSQFLENMIPYASEVEQMGSRRAPLPSFDYRSKAAIAFSQLWREIAKKTLT